jgi:catechol 2,3-dioxygenase-like lactoylglutathione lyase family enzyme
MKANLVGGVARVALGVQDLDAAVDFYVGTWGLEPAERDGELVLLTAAGSESHHILRLRENPQSRLDLVTFDAHDRAAVDDVARRAEAVGMVVLSGPGRSDGPEGGFACRILDGEGRVLEVVAERATRGHPKPAVEESLPTGLSHIVLNSPDPEALAASYCEVLGLRISDYLEDKMIFLRASQLHHAVAISRCPHVSVNHIAFEVRGVDEFMRATGRLLRSGHELIWGPGRHGPGDNTFSYFRDPNDFIVEYTTGLEIIQDEATWTPRVFRSVPEESDRWGTANPRPAAPFIGSPDPGAGIPPPC